MVVSRWMGRPWLPAAFLSHAGLNNIRTAEEQIPMDVKVVYSPGELLKKLSYPNLYEEDLVVRIMNGEMKFSVENQGEILISDIFIVC